MWTFTTAQPVPNPPKPPRLTKPANGSVLKFIGVAVHWEEVPADGIVQYEVEITDSKTSSPEPLTFITSETTTTVELPPQSEPWQWRVRARTNTGISDWSETWTFSVEEQNDNSIEPPVPLLPVDGAVVVLHGPGNRSSTYASWGLDRNDVIYIMQYAVDTTINDDSVSDTVLTEQECLIPDLQHGQTVRWLVKARTSWAESDWSPIQTFTVHMPPTKTPIAPRLLEPPNQATNVSRTAMMRWMPVEESEEYSIQISDTDVFDNWVGGFVVSGTACVSDTLEPGKRYWWRARAKNTEGPGDWSEVFSFITASDVSDVEERNRAGRLRVHPNPTNTILHVQMPEQCVAESIRVVDGGGRVVLTQKISLADQQSTLAVHMLAPGS